MLYGRTDECAAVDRLVGRVRERRSSALVIRGDPGVGKSALLRHATVQAAGLTVLQATGAEAEIELSFAALHQLLHPVIARTTDLPPPQAGALRSALGLQAGQHDRFLVSAGLLSLLAELADDQPLLVTIDDAQWLDRASAEALVFAARRLHSEGVSILFAAREGERSFDADGITEIRLTGLDEDAAGALLDEHLAADVPPPVRRELIRLTGGNPLALLELPTMLTAAQLAGRAALPDPLPVSRDVERAFLHRVRTLSPEAQSVLLIAAAEDLGDIDVIVRAGTMSGNQPDALAEVEEAGLVVVDDDRLRFHHPLVRSAVYKGASALQRRAAHRALADAFDRHADPDRSAWHRAGSTVGRDAGVADALEQSAQRARERSGYAAASRALERAADLTVEPRRAAGRLIAAADASYNAGRLERVEELLDRACPMVGDATTVADIELLRGQVERTAGTMGRAYDLLTRGAEQVAGTDAQRAVAMLTGAGLAAWGRNDHDRLREAAASIAELPFDPTTATGLAARTVQAYASIVTDDAAGAAGPIREVMRAAERSGGAYELAMAGATASFIGDDAASLRLLARATDAARSDGAVAVLVNMLAAYAAVEAWTGRVRSATAHATEGLELATQTGQRSYRAMYQATLAWLCALRGDSDGCDRLAATAARSGLDQEFAPATSMATWAVGLSMLGAGRPQEAHTRLASLVARDSLLAHPTVAIAATGDIVEAAVVADAPAVALEAVGALERFAANTHARWAVAIAARCRAVMGDGDVDVRFRDALEHHGYGTRPFERGRTLLSYGSWLRRQRRRMDAREQLRGALQLFEQLGATPWEHRTQAELRASGETVRGRDPAAVEQLTPQELQIVQIVRTGATNKQVAARLYLSPRTIDYHLRKVFVKLGLSSRAELITLTAEHPELDPVV